MLIERLGGCKGIIIWILKGLLLVAGTTMMMILQECFGMSLATKLPKFK